MNDENKHPRPRITGEAEFMAAKSAGQNGGIQEPTKEKIEIPLSAENIRACGYVLAVYRDAIKMNPDPDGPPLTLVTETKDKIDALLNVFPIQGDTR